MRRLLFISLMVCGIALLSSASLTHAQRGGSGQAEEVEREFVGVRECNSCHSEVARNHAASPHVLALQNVSRDKERITADFSQGEDVRMVQFPDEDAPRPFTADDVAYIMGSGRYVLSFMYEIERGSYVVFPAEWNTVEQRWLPYELGESWPDDPAYDWGVNCAGCHVTGLSSGRRGITWQDDGVQCEACHGGGSEHVSIANRAGRNASERDLAQIRQTIVTSPDPQICGACHSQGFEPDNQHPFPLEYQPGEDLLDEDRFSLVPLGDPDFWWPSGHTNRSNMQFNEWLISTHASALSLLEGSEFATEEACLGCHSGDYQWTQARIATYEAAERIGAHPEALTLETAQMGVTCVSCHNPHLIESEFFLVDEPYALCTSCHTDPQPTSERIHYPVQQLFEGVQIIEQVPGIASGHFREADGPDCATCHMPRVPVGSFTLASHTMQIVAPGVPTPREDFEDSCTGCHIEQANAAAMQALIEDTQAGTRLRLERIAEATEGQTLEEWLSLAIAFVEHDTSLGVHNYPYTDALLRAIEAELGLSAGVPVGASTGGNN